MKKLTVLLVSAFMLSSVAFSQSIGFGIKAGVNHNYLTGKSESGDDWSRLSYSGVGFHVGGIVDIGISQNFAIQPHLLLNSKTTKPASNTTISLLTLDLPINFLYKKNGFFAGGGPNLSYGLSAKAKEDGQDDEDLYEDPATFKRFEFGANFLMGYQCSNGLFFSANFTPGLSSIYDEDGDDTYKTTVYGFSIGFRF